MTLERLPFDDLDPEICPVCSGKWTDCSCDPDEADAAWPEDAA